MTSPPPSWPVQPIVEPAEPSAALLMYAGLLVKASSQRNERLARLYLDMAEQSGQPRQDVLSEARLRSPQDPLLQSLS